jgi:hypothetical protein
VGTDAQARTLSAAFRTDCDLFASIVNTNRNFYATPADKIDITGEFVPVFNKLRLIITGECRRSVSSRPCERLNRQEQKAPERVMARQSIRRSSAARKGGLIADLGELVHNLSHGLFDDYRPELHYMRGPGPKWHEKHDPAPASFEAMPALLRVRVK